MKSLIVHLLSYCLGLYLTAQLVQGLYFDTIAAMKENIFVSFLCVCKQMLKLRYKPKTLNQLHTNSSDSMSVPEYSIKINLIY